MRAIGPPNPKYYLSKLDREITRLRNAQEQLGSTTEVIDHGLNAAITAWHLPESYIRDQSSDIFGQDIKIFRENLIGKCADFALMHDIATHAKHLKVSRPLSQTVPNIRTSARSNMTEEEQRKVNNPSDYEREHGVFIRLSNSIQIVLKIDDRDALPVFQNIYDFLSLELESTLHSRDPSDP